MSERTPGELLVVGTVTVTPEEPPYLTMRDGSTLVLPPPVQRLVTAGERVYVYTATKKDHWHYVSELSGVDMPARVRPAKD